MGGCDDGARDAAGSVGRLLSLVDGIFFLGGGVVKCERGWFFSYFEETAFLMCSEARWCHSSAGDFHHGLVDRMEYIWV